MQEYILEQSKRDFRLFVFIITIIYYLLLASPTGDIGPGYYDIVEKKNNPFSSIVNMILFLFSSICNICESNFR